MRTEFAPFSTSKGSPNLWSYAEMGVQKVWETFWSGIYRLTVVSSQHSLSEERPFWCDPCSLYLQPRTVSQTVLMRTSSLYFQPQTVSQTVWAQQLEIKTCWRNQISSKWPISPTHSLFLIMATKRALSPSESSLSFWKPIGSFVYRHCGCFSF